MRHFKKPLIVTGITLLAALIVGIGGSTWIYQSNLSNREKTERVQMLGNGAGVIFLVIIAPFWLVAAARVGRETKNGGPS